MDKTEENRLALARAIALSLALTAASATAQDITSGGPRGRQPSGYSITKVRFFSKQGSRTEKRQHQTSFPRGDTTYINCEISFTNHLHRKRNQSLDLVCRYFGADGRKMGDAKINHHVPSAWKSGHAWSGWGWRLPGNWPVGSYRVVIFHDRQIVAEGRFKVVGDSKSRLFDSGRAKARAGDYDGAISDFSTLLGTDSNYVRAYLERGKARLKKKDHAGAISDLNRALRLDPEYIAAFAERACVHHVLKDYSAAIRDLSEAIRRNPEYEWAFRMRGDSREKQGDEIGAIADYKQALKLNPRGSNAFHRLIRLRKKRNELDAAIGDCTWLINLDPKHHYFFKRRGDLYKDKKATDKALADYRKALALKPSDGWALLSIVGIHEARKDTKQAISECTSLVRLDPKNKWAYRERGRLRLKQEDYDGAVADLDRLIELDPKNARSYVSRARAKAARKDLDGAIADCTRAIELKPKDPWSHSQRARYQARRGLSKKAIEDYRRAIQLGRYARGVDLSALLELRKKIGDTEGARGDCDWAITLAPKEAWPYAVRGRWKQERGDLEEAEEDCTRAIELDPKSGPYLTRAEIRVLRKNIDGAMEDCDRYLGPRVTDVYKLTRTVPIRRRAGRLAAAIEDCNRAIKMDPKYAAAYSWRSTCRRDMGDYDGALADIDKAIQLRPWNYMYGRRALLHLLMGDQGAAFADYATLIEKSEEASGRGWAHGVRAQAHYELGQYTEAMRDFRVACELSASSYLDNHLMLFLLRCEAGERAAATRQLEKKLETWKTLQSSRLYVAMARFLLADLSAESLLQSVERSSPIHLAGWRRAAHYFIGMRHHMDGSAAEAIRHLRISSSGTHPDETAWRLARADTRRLLLGVRTRPVSKDVAGVTIASVYAGSPAADAGIQQGDVLVRLNGAPCTQKRVEKLYRDGMVGYRVRLEYVRQGAKRSVKLLLGQSQPAVSSAPPVDTK